MTSDDPRIEQSRQMSEADPENKLGLELRSPAAQQVYDQCMAEFLQIDSR